MIAMIINITALFLIISLQLILINSLNNKIETKSMYKRKHNKIF